MHLRHIFTILALTVCVTVFADNVLPLASTSSVKRLEARETQLSSRLKELKKQHKLSDISIEQWTDGEEYIVMRDKEGRIALSRITHEGDTPLFTSGSGINFFPSVELVDHNGVNYFTLGGNVKGSYNGKYHLAGDVYTFGDHHYILRSKDAAIDLLGHQNYSWDRKSTFTFYPAVKAGFTQIDGTAATSFYHPAMEARMVWSGNPSFSGSADGCAVPGTPKILGLVVPGNAYVVTGTLPTDKSPGFRYVSTGFTEDGKEKKTRVYAVEGCSFEADPLTKARRYYTNMQLLSADGKVLVDSANTYAFNFDDQVIYFRRDDQKIPVRTGAYNPMYPALSVPALFADVKYVPDGSGVAKPWVKLRSFSDWEPYDPKKKYSLDSIPEWYMWFEVDNFDNFLMTTKKKPEEMNKEEALMYIYSAGMFGTPVRNKQRQVISEFYNGRDATSHLENIYTVLNVTLSVGELAADCLFKAVQVLDHAKTLTGDGEYKWWMEQFDGYIRSLWQEVDMNLTTHIPHAKRDYDSYVNMLALNRQQAALNIQQSANVYLQDAKPRAQATEQAQAKFVNAFASLMGSIVNLASGGKVKPVNYGISAPVGYKAVATKKGTAKASTTPAGAGIYTPTGQMLNSVQMPAEFYSMPVDYSSSSSSSSSSVSSSSTSSSSGSMCHKCYGRGRCVLCNGQGRYIPSVSVGKYVDCTSCHKSGNCPSCGGTGHH